MSIISKGLQVGLGVLSTLITEPILSGKLGFDPRNAIINSTLLTYSLWTHYIGNLSDIKPAAVIAGIPLPSVDELSHGISDREVRYRANGGVFLSHQTGGNESLRIIGKAWGDNRFMFLNMLDLLFMWGTTQQVDVITSNIASCKELEIAKSVPIARTGKIAKRLKELTTDPWEVFNKENLSEGYQEQHMTFPVITKNRVYLSMYIETYSWRQRLDKENRKMVEYTIFFRKYEPQPEWDLRTLTIPGKTETENKYLVVYKEKTVESPAIYAAWKASVEILATYVINQEALEFDNYTNFGQQFMLNYFGSNPKEGRIPGIIEERGFF